MSNPNWIKGCSPWNKGLKIGDRCRKKKLWLPRNCPYCGKEFFAYPSGKVYCSLSCRSLLNAKRDENSIQWKGDEAGYSAIHYWIQRKKGKASKCEFCGKEGKCHWANLDGEYNRKMEDFISLCPSCHFRFDIENGRWGQTSLHLERGRK